MVLEYQLSYTKPGIEARDERRLVSAYLGGLHILL